MEYSKKKALFFNLFLENTLHLFHQTKENLFSLLTQTKKNLLHFEVGLLFNKIVIIVHLTTTTTTTTIIAQIWFRFPSEHNSLTWFSRTTFHRVYVCIVQFQSTID